MLWRLSTRKVIFPLISIHSYCRPSLLFLFLSLRRARLVQRVCSRPLDSDLHRRSGVPLPFTERLVHLFRTCVAGSNHFAPCCITPFFPTCASNLRLNTVCLTSPSALLSRMRELCFRGAPGTSHVHRRFQWASTCVCARFADPPFPSVPHTPRIPLTGLVLVEKLLYCFPFRQSSTVTRHGVKIV